MSTIINAGRHDISITSDLSGVMKDFFQRSESTFSSVFVVSDENTHRHCLPLLNGALPVDFHQIVIGSGELNKNLQTCRVAWSKLLEHDADRDALIINLGGGMVSDLGGFVASTYKRGIRFINIPTSLLGMVDASAGGKTGIDLNQFKNMVGTFAFPETVIIDSVFLNTLPEKEWKNGVAEMIKHGLISDPEIWLALKEEINKATAPAISDSLKNSIVGLLEKTISVKAKIVTVDPFEKKERMFLNFGHTIGHALESHSLSQDDIPLSHGEAVAAGMLCESFLSMKLCGLSTESLIEISSVIAGFFPRRIIHGPAFQELIHLMKADKKSSGGKINFALLQNIGTPVIHKGISTDLILESFHYYNSVQK